MTDSTPEARAARLGEAAASVLNTPEFPNSAGWTLVSAGALPLMSQMLPVVKFAKDGTSLCFIVTPTDPETRVYKRTSRHDVVYYSEDVPDAEQNAIYERDKAMIDGFVSWLTEWDKRSESVT